VSPPGVTPSDRQRVLHLRRCHKASVSPLERRTADLEVTEGSKEVQGLHAHTCTRGGPGPTLDEALRDPDLFARWLAPYGKLVIDGEGPFTKEARELRLIPEKGADA
jgi:hypothetical protein